MSMGKYLSVDDVSRVIDLRKVGVSATDMQKFVDLSYSAICRIVKAYDLISTRNYEAARIWAKEPTNAKSARFVAEVLGVTDELNDDNRAADQPGDLAERIDALLQGQALIEIKLDGFREALDRIADGIERICEAWKC